MKKLFVAIRNNDIETVKVLLEKKPELISCTAKQPPKKDDGQSPLQVSLKYRKFEITDLLISLGADVNAKDSYGNSCMDIACLSSTQILSRYNYCDETFSKEREFTQEVRKDLSKIFKLLLKHGADLYYISPNRTMTILDFYKNQNVYEFLC